MVNKSEYFVCPDCNKKGVYFRLGHNGEDVYTCRYCGFYFFTQGTDNWDRENERRAMQVNPDGPFSDATTYL